MNSNEHEHKKILIDNAICKRRFHLVYEENSTQKGYVKIKCPHCSVTLFEAENHEPMQLAREENLVKAPLGDAEIVYSCEFNAK